MWGVWVLVMCWKISSKESEYKKPYQNIYPKMRYISQNVTQNQQFSTVKLLWNSVFEPNLYLNKVFIPQFSLDLVIFLEISKLLDLWDYVINFTQYTAICPGVFTYNPLIIHIRSTYNPLSIHLMTSEGQVLVIHVPFQFFIVFNNRFFSTHSNNRLL